LFAFGLGVGLFISVYLRLCWQVDYIRHYSLTPLKRAKAASATYLGKAEAADHARGSRILKLLDDHRGTKVDRAAERVYP
jgi:hypothetical protein